MGFIRVCCTELKSSVQLRSVVSKQESTFSFMPLGLSYQRRVKRDAEVINL